MKDGRKIRGRGSGCVPEGRQGQETQEGSQRGENLNNYPIQLNNLC